LIDRCRRPARWPILTVRHCQERLQWTMQRHNWRHQQWRTITSSNESRYSILYADDCKRSGIGLSCNLGPAFFQNIGPGRGNGVTTARYIDHVFRPFSRYRNDTFQHDNVRDHSARATIDFLRQTSIEVMPWSKSGHKPYLISIGWYSRRLNEDQTRSTAAAEPIRFSLTFLHDKNRFTNNKPCKEKEGYFYCYK